MVVVVLEVAAAGAVAAAVFPAADLQGDGNETTHATRRYKIG
jgi:hypothetical protein